MYRKQLNQALRKLGMAKKLIIFLELLEKKNNNKQLQRGLKLNDHEVFFHFQNKPIFLLLLIKCAIIYASAIILKLILNF